MPESNPNSTNPFDSPATKGLDFPDTLNSHDSDQSDTSFYDAQELENDHGNSDTTKQRSANLNFAQPFDDVGTYVLDVMANFIDHFL
jgi:hypothetical protein